jgi:hypothetical protein
LQRQEAPTLAGDDLSWWEKGLVEGFAAPAIVAGTTVHEMVKATLHGFVVEVKAESGTKGPQLWAKVKEIFTSGSQAALFVLHYYWGLVKGILSPITGLFDLGVLVVKLLYLGAQIMATSWARRSELAAKAEKIAEGIGALAMRGGSAIAGLLSQPFNTIKALAPWFSSLEKDAITAAETGGHKIGKLLLSQLNKPVSELAESAGEIVGTVLVNAVLLIFTAGIGDAIAQIASKLGELGAFLGKFGEAAQMLGRLVTELGELLTIIGGWITRAEALFAKAATAVLKPIAPVLEELGNVLNNLRSFLRELLGVSEEAAGAAAERAAAGAAHAAEGRVPPSSVRPSPKLVPEPKPTPVTREPTPGPIPAEPQAAPGPTPPEPRPEPVTAGPQAAPGLTPPKTRPAPPIPAEPQAAPAPTPPEPRTEPVPPEPQPTAEPKAAPREAPAPGAQKELSDLQANKADADARLNEALKKQLDETARANELRKRAAIGKSADLAKQAREAEDAARDAAKAVERAKQEAINAQLALQRKTLELNTDLRSKLPCFASGTNVWTPTGPRVIDRIRVNDIVLAYDFENHSTVQRYVQKIYRNRTMRFFYIEVDSIVILATSLHRFWVEPETDWVEARCLRVGMNLRKLSGETAIVTRIESHDSPFADTYNLSIEGSSNYFVGPGVLVHNDGGPSYNFGKLRIYEGINPNPKFADKIYIGQTDSLTRRQGEHRAEAIEKLKDPSLSPEEREFWEFKRDIVLKERVSGLDPDQANYLEQKNMDIETQIRGEKNVMNRREQVSRANIAELERRIKSNPRVQEAKLCQ